MDNKTVTESELKSMINEFKRKANRPHAYEKDVERLLKSCGYDVDLAVSLILKE